MSKRTLRCFSVSASSSLVNHSPTDDEDSEPIIGTEDARLLVADAELEASGG